MRVGSVPGFTAETDFVASAWNPVSFHIKGDGNVIFYYYCFTKKKVIQCISLQLC